jgi:hypothetical protein
MCVCVCVWRRTLYASLKCSDFDPFSDNLLQNFVTKFKSTKSLKNSILVVNFEAKVKTFESIANI